MTCEHPTLASRPWLLVLTAGGSGLAATLLGVADANPALGVHLTAPPPFGVFSDQRWLLVFHPGLAAFALELAAAVALRTAFIVGVIRLAWPVPDTAPSLRETVRHVALYVVVAHLLLWLFTGMQFGLAVTPVSWLFLAGTIPVLLLGMFVNLTAIPGRPWPHPTWRSAGWASAAFLVLTVGGAVTAVSPDPWLAGIAATLTGLFNGWAWFGLVHESACKTTPANRVPVAPLAVATLFAVFVGASAWAIDAVVRPGGPTAPRVMTERGTEPVLVAGGFSSQWDGTQHSLLAPPYAEVQFSYAGLDADGRPLPYGPEDTHASLPVLARRMAEQVASMAERFGRPVHVIAQSEGSLVAALYAAQADDDHVGQVLLLSPLLVPARVHYPPGGAGGWGVAGGAALRVVTSLVASISPYETAPDLPFIRSLVRRAPLTRRLLTCVSARDDVVVLVPIADALGTPLPEQRAAFRAVPAWHAGFLRGDRPARLVQRALAGEPVEVSGRWSASTRIASALGSSWHVPTLPLGLVPEWRASPLAADGASCDQVRDVADAWMRTEGRP